MSNEYPKDEFDRLGEDMPVGIHRLPPSRWRAVLPFLAVIIIAPLLAWGAAHFLTSRGGTPSQTASVESTQSAAATSAAPAETRATEIQSSPAEEPSTETPQSAAVSDVRRDVHVSVLNDSGVSGVARENANALNIQGFTNTEAGNNTSWQVTVPTVFYASDEMRATALEIGRILNIPTVQMPQIPLDASTIVVILK